MTRPSMKLQQELLAMPEWKLLQRIQQFGTSIRILEDNAKDLSELLHFLTADPRSMFLSNVSRRASLDQAFEEVLRRLHNFVASALTLVDHTRILYRELYEEKGIFPEYNEEVKRRFVDVPLLQFVQGLRHFAQHYRLPSVSHVMHGEQGKGITRRLVLHKADRNRSPHQAALAA